MAVEKAAVAKKAAVKKDEASNVGAAAAVDALEAEESGEAPDTHDVLVVRDRRFRLVNAISAMTMMRLSAASDPKTTVPEQMGAIKGFLERVIVKDDREEFLVFLEDAEPVIDFEEINQILTDATEAIAARPTQP